MYVDSQDIDEIYARAVKNGATITVELDNMFWGQRWCQFVDPYGTHWMVAKVLEPKPVEASTDQTPSKASNKASTTPSRPPGCKHFAAS